MSARSRLGDTIRENVKLVKQYRQLTDDQIASDGGYRSRQAFNARLAGRTRVDTDDIERIAAALKVEPHILLLPLGSDILRWIEDNPSYKSPKIGKSDRTRSDSPAPPQVRRRRQAAAG